MCCPGGSEPDHAWKWCVVSVTDNWAKVEAKMFTIEFGSLVTIKKIAYLNQVINNDIFTFAWLLLL